MMFYSDKIFFQNQGSGVFTINCLSVLELPYTAQFVNLSIKFRRRMRNDIISKIQRHLSSAKQQYNVSF